LIDQADLEKKTIEALRDYRKALARVESQEEAEASAQRALTEMLPDFKRAILEDCAPSVKDNLFQTGVGAVSRSNEAWDALRKATTTLEVARQTLVALEQQLGYIPGVSKAAAYPRPSGIAQIVANRFQAQTRGWLLAAFVASRIMAPVGIDALLRAETPAIGELRELPLQHMPAGFDRGHVLDELTDLSRERVIARRPRALQLSRVVEISLPDCVLA
jgi:hypothetical protein